MANLQLVAKVFLENAASARVTAQLTLVTGIIVPETMATYHYKQTLIQNCFLARNVLVFVH